MDSKRDIRKRILTERSFISQEAWAKKSRIILEKVTNHPFFIEADTIYCYVDYNGEVQTRTIIEHAWQSKKKVAVPKIVGDEMHFYYINQLSDLINGYHGIPEPEEASPACDKHALVIMPGVAFDKNKNRIGYGKGFYDKFLNGHLGHTMAIGFEVQIVDNIPAEMHDFCPEILITEEQIYE